MDIVDTFRVTGRCEYRSAALAVGGQPAREQQVVALRPPASCATAARGDVAAAIQEQRCRVSSSRKARGATTIYRC